MACNTMPHTELHPWDIILKLNKYNASCHINILTMILIYTHTHTSISKLMNIYVDAASIIFTKIQYLKETPMYKLNMYVYIPPT